jgi:hypothetical protein
MALFILAMSNIIGGKLAQKKEMFTNQGCGEINCLIEPDHPCCATEN